MTNVSQPPRATRQQPFDWSEAVSDASPVEQELILMGDQSLHHYVAPGTVSHALGYEHVPLTHARSEGSASASNSRNFGSFGAANEPSVTNKIGK